MAVLQVAALRRRLTRLGLALGGRSSTAALLQLRMQAMLLSSLASYLLPRRAPAVPHRNTNTCCWPVGTLTVRPCVPADGFRARAMPPAPPLMVTMVSQRPSSCIGCHMSSNRRSDSVPCASSRCGVPNDNSLHLHEKGSEKQGLTKQVVALQPSCHFDSRTPPYTREEPVTRARGYRSDRSDDIVWVSFWCQR